MVSFVAHVGGNSSTTNPANKRPNPVKETHGIITCLGREYRDECPVPVTYSLYTRHHRHSSIYLVLIIKLCLPSSSRSLLRWLCNLPCESERNALTRKRTEIEKAEKIKRSSWMTHALHPPSLQPVLLSAGPLSRGGRGVYGCPALYLNVWRRFFPDVTFSLWIIPVLPLSVSIRSGYGMICHVTPKSSIKSDKSIVLFNHYCTFT